MIAAGNVGGSNEDSRYAVPLSFEERVAAMSNNRLLASVEVEEISAADGRAMLDIQTQDKLGIGAIEFLARLDAGDYENTDDEGVVRLAMLAPFGR